MFKNEGLLAEELRQQAALDDFLRGGTNKQVAAAYFKPLEEATYFATLDDSPTTTARLSISAHKAIQRQSGKRTASLVWEAPSGRG